LNASLIHPSTGPSSRLLLNLGCGPEVTKTRWTDIDGSWNLMVQTVWWGRLFAGYVAGRSGFRWPAHVQWMDITRRLPFNDESVDAIYASHVLEHLYRDDALRLLNECKRVLKPEGVIRLVLPDLKTMATDYLAARTSDAAVLFNQQLLMREPHAPRGLIGKLKYFFADHHSHKFMYDVPLLISDLEYSGFRDGAEHFFLESRIPEIREVERAGRVLNGAGIIVEARK
jgi:SAM-dependent methyltransferase